jgi:hypothetical protein
MTNHIKCTLTDDKSWCGALLDNSFGFKDTEAAVLSKRFKHGIPVCAECIKVVTDYLCAEYVEPVYENEMEQDYGSGEQLTFADCIIGIKKHTGN